MPVPDLAADVAPNVAIVGTGPTGLYTLHHLLASRRPLTVTLFDAADLAGVGQPYSPEAAGPMMLANIASIEIPPLGPEGDQEGGETYLSWLRRQPPAFLRVYGVDPDTLHARQFLPRLLLGGWLRDGLDRMVAAAPAQGCRVAVREGARVVDVGPEGADLRVDFTDKTGPHSLLFTHVVLATGHAWPEDPAHPGRYASPWNGLMQAAIPAGRVGVLGTSLSAIDAAMAVACQHGAFGPDDAAFTLHPDSQGLTITLMSRQGLLPEADFWCPIPYAPLARLTPDAVARAVAAGAEGLLDRLWALMVAELALADPAWAQGIGLDALSVDTFPSAYFAPRLATDPFAWAAQNLAEVTRNAARQRVVAWRYAILRMHAAFEGAVTHLTDTDRARFDGLKRVFVDNYAAVPPQSIRRLLALHRAGCLGVLPLGEGYSVSEGPVSTAVVPEGGAEQRFDVVIDARGQRALGAEDLPFPRLRAALPRGEVAMDDGFALRDAGDGRLFLPAAPYLLHRLPFAQGITASADLGAAVAGAILGG